MNKYNSSSIKNQPLGIVLQEANLISFSQIQVALQDQRYYPDLRLGEILATRGWIKSETADFFAVDWSKIVRQNRRKQLGYYLKKSALLEDKDIQAILKEQIHTGVRFGSIAVLNGLIKSETLDFFLLNLFPKEADCSSLVVKTKSSLNKNIFQNTYQRTNDSHLWQSQLKVNSSNDFEIIWVD